MMPPIVALRIVKKPDGSKYLEFLVEGDHWAPVETFDANEEGDIIDTPETVRIEPL